MASKAMAGEGPRIPHRAPPNKEIGDLRADVDDSFERLENMTDWPKLVRLTGGNVGVPINDLPVSAPFVGEDLLQSQVKASKAFGVGTAQLTFTANRPGTPGNAISVELKTGAGEVVAVVGTVITITLDVGVSTANTIKALVDADTDAKRLVQVASGGAGVVLVAAATLLTGGVGAGFIAYVNGIAQEVNGPVTDTACPLEITDLTGAADLDELQLFVSSDEVSSHPMQISLLTELPRIIEVPDGATMSISGSPLSVACVGSDLLQGKVQGTLTFGTGTAQLDVTANRPGTPGNDITVELATGGAESVAVVGDAITVTLNTGVSTPDSVKATMDADAATARLVTTVSGGAGVILVAAATNLAGGTGSGFIAAVGGVAQEVNGKITDILLPLEIATSVGMVDGDVLELLVTSNSVKAPPIDVSILAIVPRIIEVPGGAVLPIDSSPASVSCVGSNLLKGKVQGTLTFGTGTAQLDFTANRPGTPGNAITVEIVDSAGGGLAVTVVGSDIEIDKGGAADDADAIKAALDASAAIARLISTVSGGAGVPAVTAQDNLAGGTGSGFVVTIGGVAQEVNSKITDVLLPLEAATGTGMVDGDVLELLVTSNGIIAPPMDISILATPPRIVEVPGGATLSIGGTPVDAACVGVGLLQGKVQGTLTFGTGTAQLDFTANRPGTPGNAITVAIVDSAGGGLAIAVVGDAIEIDMGGASPTADQVKAALDGDADAVRLIATVSGGGGAVAVTTLANLTGGTGSGFVTTVGGVAQEVNGKITDVLLPIEIATGTGMTIADVMELLVTSNGVSSPPIGVIIIA